MDRIYPSIALLLGAGSPWSRGRAACRRALRAAAITAALATWGCTRDNVDHYQHGFPDLIDRILEKNCATSGCHTTQSALAAGGLSLASWDALFAGSRGGSAVIPYSPDQSFLLHAVNDDSSRGPILVPTMPLNQSPLSDADYNELVAWIAAGARNASGRERFPPRADRRKWYVAHHGCDLVAVLDAESRQVMRYVEVGDPGVDEQVFSIHISPDRQFWYVLFGANTPRIEQYSTLTDAKVADIALSHKIWNTMAFTPDGKWAFVVSGAFQDVAVVDLVQGAVVGSPFPVFRNVLGAAVHPQRAELYLTDADSSALVVLRHDSSGGLASERVVDLVQGVQPAIGGALWPYDVQFAPDGSTYYVTCWHSQEVRVFAAATDSLLAVIGVGEAPTRMAFSAATGQLFVACMEETAAFGGDATKRGAVAVIDMGQQQMERLVYAGFQPHGLAVDAAHGYLVVASRNLRQDGPVQHHASLCAGRNGYVTLIDMTTWEAVAGYRPELSADPFSVVVKE
jgi:YVTN family beta-propeller protein